MSSRFVSIDRNQPLLLPPDLRDWIPEDDLVHFVIAAVEGMSLSVFKVNARGTGSAQYPPHMMLSLLIYCYANGIFSSRRIERATHRDIAVRYLTGDTHPDHDTSCTVRRENFDAGAACFVHVLEWARELKLLTVGTVSVDGTKMRANANKTRSIRYDRAGELIEQLELEVRELMEQAEQTDQSEQADGQSLPDELARREALNAKLEAARKRLEDRAQKKADSEQAEYERKVKAREARNGKGSPIKKPDPTPKPSDQDNLTDPDSRLMCKNKSSGFDQDYNAQAAVAAIKGIPDSVGQPETVLADNVYLNEAQVRALEGDGEEPKMNVLVSVHAEAKQLRRKHDFRPKPGAEKPPPKISSEFVLEMKEKMEQDASREKYRLRKQSVEPVFGTIKKWLGFTQFSLRGHENVDGEWKLVTLAFNLKRMCKMLNTQNQAPSPA